MNQRTICIAIITVSFLFTFCNHQTDKRKIQLSYGEANESKERSFASTLHLEPTRQISIGVLFFQNLTGDQNLQWLQKGLTEMFVRSLSQTRSISVLSMDRLFDIYQRFGNSIGEDDLDKDMAVLIGSETNVEAVLSGSISKEKDFLKIRVKLHEPQEGQIIKEESVEGSGLETLFSMVDDLTFKIKKDLQLSFDKDEPIKGITDLSTNSLEAWQYYTTGLDLFNKFLITESAEFFQRAALLDTTFASAYLKLFECNISMREISNAQNILDRLKKISYKATSHERYQIDYYIAALNQDLEAMFTIYRQWLEQYPDDIEPIRNMAHLYYGLGKFQDAIHYFKKVLSIDPQNKLVLNMLGYAYAHIGDFSSAIASLEKYKTLVSDEPNPYDSMGEIYLFIGNYREAEKWFRRALNINKHFTPSLEHLGNLYMETGEYNKALEAFENYLAIVPEGNLKALGYARIANAHSRFGEYEEAVKNYQKSLEINIYQANTVETLYDLYLTQNDSLKGVELLETHYHQMKTQLPLNDSRNNFYQHLLYLSVWYGIQIDETINLLQQIITNTENDIFKQQVRYQLSLLYSKKKSYEKIEQLWENSGTIQLVHNFSRGQNISYNDLWKTFQFINEALYQDIKEGIDMYHGLIDAAIQYQSKPFEVGFRLLLADIYFYNGQTKEGRKQLRLVGMPEEDQWLVNGPFENIKGFGRMYSPEKRIVLDDPDEDKIHPVTWQPVNDGMKDGYINLKRIFKSSDWSVSYGLIAIQSNESQIVQFRIGSNEAVKIWLNDEEIWKFNQVRSSIFDDDIVDVTLKQGINKVLIKICNRWKDWGFYFRVTDEEGNGIQNIQFISANQIKDLT